MAHGNDTEILMLTGKQAAAFVGVGYRQFTNFLKGPYPPPRTDSKKYPSDALGRWVVERTIRTHTVQNGDGELLDPQQENARKNKELADKTMLENQVRRGELIEADGVEAAWSEILSRVRTRMLRVPAVAAPLVVGEDDTLLVQETIDETVRDALMEMSADWREEDDEPDAQ